MKTKKNYKGILLGIAFLAIGIGDILFPELRASYTPENRPFVSFFALANLLVGSFAVLYYSLLK